VIAYEGGGVNGNPLYHWIALAVSTVLMLPVPVAILAGWTPPWMRKRQVGMRLRAYGILCIYALMLVNGIPRIADASIETVMVWMNVGFGFAAAAVVLFLLSARKDSGARTADPVEPREG
jgi:bacteriorhodopsin